MTIRALICVWTGALVGLANATSPLVGRAFLTTVASAKVVQARQDTGPERTGLLWSARLRPNEQSTVRDGVYGEEQATRGKAMYDTKCASCHDGGTMGPELWGDPFLASWENKALAEFYTRVKMTMPEDAPGSLSPKEVLDVIAYVLKTNGFPAGDNAMDSADPLTAIKFVKK